MFDDYYDEYVLVAKKRAWAPDWLYRVFCINLPFFGQPSLIFPFKQLLHKVIADDDGDSDTTE